MKPDVEQNLLKIKALFEANSQLYAHVIQFGITHGVLTLAVHEGNFLQRVQFVCGGCFHFCGDFEGGPYTLKIFRHQMSYQILRSLQSEAPTHVS